MYIWIAFFLMIFFFLALDLGVFNKKAHEITYREASRWTAFWITFSMMFSLVIYYIYDKNLLNYKVAADPFDQTIKFLTGYFVELTLSVDNIFVIALIFKSFKIPLKYQHRVLFWGILGALIARGVMIFLGVFIIQKFSWMIYVFGAFLLYTAYKMMKDDDEAEFDPKNIKFIRWIRRILPVSKHLEGQKFLVKKMGIWIATPLLLVLVLIELTDVLFALDSIPAILAITTDPFIVFSSNILAILGLRSMYFFLANMMVNFAYLKQSLIVILVFVAIKLLISHYVIIPPLLSLGVIFTSLIAGVFFSIRQKNKNLTASAPEEV
jgi:tellurite resistance protein TerC